MTFAGPVSVLDYVGVAPGQTATEAIGRSIELAQAVERFGYRRQWFSEHHNTATLACTAPELIIVRVAAATTTLRVGAGGIMLPNHAPLKVAETFNTLEAMFPERVDLGLGRAPGTDGTTAVALRRSREALFADDFPEQVGELFAFLGYGAEFPEGHPFANVLAAPQVPEPPEVWILGSSDYGARFAATNGLATAFAHQINPGPAVDALRRYRETFQPSERLAEPRSLLSTNAFASEDPEAVSDFVAYWTLTMYKLRQGVRTPTSMVDAREFAAGSSYRHVQEALGRQIVAGPPEVVADGLRSLAEACEADELMVVTPSPDHGSRLRSYELIAAELGLTTQDVADDVPVRRAS